MTRARMLVLLLISTAAAGGWSLAWSATATATARPLPLTSRLIRPSDFHGFRPDRPKRFVSAKHYVAGDASLTKPQATTKLARLRREGFKAIAIERLESSNPNQAGLSWVMRLKSGRAARAELAAATREAERQSGSRFPVRPIPGARGVGTPAGRSGSGNVLFADGPYVYLVGVGWNDAASPPTRAQLIAAATTLYRRVHPTSG